MNCTLQRPLGRLASDVLIGLASISAGIALWQYAASELTSSILFPGPLKVAKALLSRSGLDLVMALSTTLKESRAGVCRGQRRWSHNRYFGGQRQMD